MRAWRARLLVLAAFCSATAACDDSAGPSDTPDLSQPWATAPGADLGVDTTILARARIHADAIPRFRTLLVARRGQLVMEQYLHGSSRETPNDVRSVTKSVVSTLIGIAVAHGEIKSIDDPIVRYIGDTFRFDAIDSTVTIRHLLTMSGGWRWPENTGAGTAYGDWIRSSDHVQYVLNQPHAAQPGATFEYNSGAVHVLGVVLEHAVGQSLPDYARDVLFQPLGVEQVAWEPFPNEGVNGAAGVRLTGQDLLRLGQLYLQGGRSGSQQIVPADWINQAVNAAYNWRQQDGPQAGLTYGWLWWIGDVPGAHAYFAWGYGGQFVYVVPALDLVVVATTDFGGITSDGGVGALTNSVFGVIVNDILPAAGVTSTGGLTASRMLPAMLGGWELPRRVRDR